MSDPRSVPERVSPNDVEARIRAMYSAESADTPTLPNLLERYLAEHLAPRKRPARRRRQR